MRVSLDTTTARNTSWSPTSTACGAAILAYSVCTLSLTTRRMWSDADKLLLNTKNLERALPTDVWKRRRQGFQVSSPVVAEEDFLGLRFVQSEVILRRPSCNVIDLSGPCADIGGRDDEVRVISELDEYVVGVERSRISCFDCVCGWSNARALYDADRDASRARDVSTEHGMV